MNSIIYFYLIIVFLLLVLKPMKDTTEWKYKYILIYLGTFILSISFFVDNNNLACCRVLWNYGFI